MALVDPGVAERITEASTRDEHPHIVDEIQPRTTASAAAVAIRSPLLTGNLTTYLILIALACWLAIVGSAHEPWSDEAQAWLLARDNSLADLLLREVRYEGSPGLWHVLLWLLQRAGLPFSGLWLVSSALALAGAAVVLLKAPFPLWLRTACVTSYFFAYQYAVVARSYALDLFLLSALAALFQIRHKRPLVYCTLLGLCANCNAHSFIIASILFAEFLIAAWRAKMWALRTAQACAIFAAFAAGAVFQARVPADLSFIVGRSGVSWVYALIQIDDAFMGSISFMTGAGLNPRTITMQWLATGLLLTPSIVLFRRAGVLPLFASLVASLIVFAFVEFANVWHAGFLYLAWLFCLWQSWPHAGYLQRKERYTLIGSLALLSAIQTYGAVAAGLREIASPYSSGPAMAVEIKAYRATHPHARIAGMGFKTFAVAPWFSGNIFANYNGGAERPAYYKWITTNHFAHAVELPAWRKLAAGGYDALLLSPGELKRPVMGTFITAAIQAGYCLAAKTEGGMIWRGSIIENDDMFLFERGSICAGRHAV
jgi:hypothetical protein